jgi:3-hydroxybutyryl-CoA dehydrogenase
MPPSRRSSSRRGEARLFKRLDSLLPEADFLASDTSSVPIMKLSAETSRPERVLALHFFNPVPVLPLVEVVRSMMTSQETLQIATEFASERLGKTPINAEDRAGFIVQRPACALHVLGDPHVRVGFRLQRGHRPRNGARLRAPDGAARAAYLVGLDTEAGLLGRKSGRGSYGYTAGNGT